MGGRCRGAGDYQTRPSPFFPDTEGSTVYSRAFYSPFAIFSANPSDTDWKKLHIDPAFSQPLGRRTEGKTTAPTLDYEEAHSREQAMQIAEGFKKTAGVKEERRNKGHPASDQRGFLRDRWKCRDGVERRHAAPGT